MENQQDPRTMTADTIGKDLLSALVTELKLLPKPWPELSNGKQDDTIDRLREREHHRPASAGPVDGPVWPLE